MSKIPLQLQQFLGLALLVSIGFYTSSIYLSPFVVVSIVLFSLACEHLFLYIRHKGLSFFSYSAASTALSVVLMMSSAERGVYYVVVLAALLQKHFLRLDNKHLFNPSSFGLIIGLLFFYDRAHLVSGQLGDLLLFAGMSAAVALPVLFRARRWMISLSFVCAYLLLQYSIVVVHDPVMLFESVYFRFYSISFLLFVFFMLTDPAATPETLFGQLGFAFTIALAATLLDYYMGFRVQHLFMALFLLTPIFRLYEVWDSIGLSQRIIGVVVIVLALGAIITIEVQPPYYFEMDG